MERYYYHGFDHLGYEDGIKFMTNIILSGGIKTRNDVASLNDDSFEHVCLYRKNEDCDYGDKDTYYKSARYCYIDKCMSFVIDPSIEAERKEGSYIDEYRSVGNIPNSKIVGIAIPFEQIYNYSASLKPDDKKRLEELLKRLIDVSTEFGFIIHNSDEENFTDKLDEQLNKQANK